MDDRPRRPLTFQFAFPMRFGREEEFEMLRRWRNCKGILERILTLLRGVRLLSTRVCAPGVVWRLDQALMKPGASGMRSSDLLFLRRWLSTTFLNRRHSAESTSEVFPYHLPLSHQSARISFGPRRCQLHQKCRSSFSEVWRHSFAHGSERFFGRISTGSLAFPKL